MKIIPDATKSVNGRSNNCRYKSVLKLELSADDTRVTIIPAQIEVRSAGI